MALAIGGNTIEELQSKMTVNELNIWGRYFDRYGPVNPERMYDKGAAILASQMNLLNGRKFMPIDFMPYSKKHESESSEIILETEDDLMKALGGVAKIVQRR